MVGTDACVVDTEWLRTKHPFAFYSCNGVQLLQQSVCNTAAGQEDCGRLKWPREGGSAGVCKWKKA